MNLLEQKMLNVLKSLRDDYGVIGIKAEFEAEGTRIDELMRLIEIVRKLNLKLVLADYKLKIRNWFRKILKL